MRHHSHLTLQEREDIMVLKRSGRSITEIAVFIGRDKSTVSREISRNSCAKGTSHEHYRASTAQKRYEERRRACRRPRLLDDAATFSAVSEKFLGEQWSPEQIEGRLRLEGGPTISDSTIYRGIANGMFDALLNGRRAARKLRHKGKRRRGSAEERRGKIAISNDIAARPVAADARSRIGDWEGDTMLGKSGGSCLVTLVDRLSGYLVGGKSSSKRAEPVRKTMTKSLIGKPLHTVTLDRGKEFAEHPMASDDLDVEFYFALPGHPWQRGTNENTNGLLREYFPKGRSLDDIDESDVAKVYDKLNRRPRKRLGYRTPHEVFYNTALQLV